MTGSTYEFCLHLLSHNIINVPSRIPFGTLTRRPASPVKDLTSGPTAPDIEILWTPALLLNNGFTDPPSDAEGFTIVRPISQAKLLFTKSNLRYNI